MLSRLTVSRLAPGAGGDRLQGAAVVAAPARRDEGEQAGGGGELGLAGHLLPGPPPAALGVLHGGVAALRDEPPLLRRDRRQPPGAAAVQAGDLQAALGDDLDVTSGVGGDQDADLAADRPHAVPG